MPLIPRSILFGNPVYPAGTDSFDFGDRKLLSTLGPRPENLVRNLSDLDSRILDRRKAMGGMLENIAGWGVVALERTGQGVPAGDAA